jgi:peptidoglycan/xylan/chitin deacetylase (PgdA/CDA1 family)
MKLWTRVKARYRRSASQLLARRPAVIHPFVPVISFTFDDFPLSALLVGGSILRRHGLAGTYYASLGLMGQDAPAGQIFSAPDLKSLLADGHELGCHTYAHCDAWNTNSQNFEMSIVENAHALAQLAPGCSLKTLSYPISSPRPGNKRRAGFHFACCRGGGQAFNAGTVDLNYIQAFFLEQSRNNPDAVKMMIDQNREKRGWLVFATHDVCENPSGFGCTPDFFEKIVRHAVQSGARILPVFKAWEAVRSAVPGDPGPFRA